MTVSAPLWEWGLFSNALPLASTFLLYRNFSRLWYGTSHGKTSAPPPARQTGTSGCEVSVKALATNQAACRTCRGHSPAWLGFHRLSTFVYILWYAIVLGLHVWVRAYSWLHVFLKYILTDALNYEKAPSSHRGAEGTWR